MRRLILALLTSVPLVACVTVEDGPIEDVSDVRASAPERSGIDDPDGFNLAALDPKALEEGECGLFLFTSNPSPRFVFFSNDSRGFAEMRIDGRDALLQRVSTAGTPIVQSYSEQVFRDGRLGVEVALTLNPGDPMTDGYEISSGAMRLTKGDGWSMVIPVSGAAACQFTPRPDIG